MAMCDASAAAAAAAVKQFLVPDAAMARQALVAVR